MPLATGREDIGLFSFYINLPNQSIVDFHLLVGLHKCPFPLIAILENEGRILGLALLAGFWYNSLARMNTMEHSLEIDTEVGLLDLNGNTKAGLVSNPKM